MEEPEPKSNKLLAKGFVILAAANMMSMLVREQPSLLAPCVILSFLYVIYLMWRTVRLLKSPDNLSKLDKTLCKWSGPLGVIPGTVFLTMFILMDINGYDPDKYFFAYDVCWFVFQLTSEIGLILIIACLAMQPEKGLHIPPIKLWKVICVPYVLVYIVYVAGSLTGGFGESM